jgi:hypothetical protein
MTDRPPIHPLLKRGALVTAANWPVVAIQFAADTSFKLLLTVPVVGGALLVGAAAGGDLRELTDGDLRAVVAATADALAATPVALAAFVAAFALVLVGGAVVMFFVKAGTVAVLAQAERMAESIERPPLRLTKIRRAARFSVDRFLGGARRLARPYLVLGSVLILVYATSGSAYLLLVLTAYRAPGSPAAVVGWTVITVLASVGFLAWILAVNLAYLLMQMVIGADRCGVRAAAARLALFVRQGRHEIAGIFGVVLALVALSTTASVVAAAGFGLIAFVPIVGLVVLPLQLAAWLLRGALLQYLGLTALGAYLAAYRAHRRQAGFESPRPSAASDAESFPEGRTA